MIRFLTLIIIAATFSTPALAKISYTDWYSVSGPYLGQHPPGMVAEVFAPGLISTAQSEINSVFTPDGNEFYFTGWSKEVGTKIMVTRQTKGRWSKPEVASFSEQYSNVDPALSQNGQRIYFGTRRPRPGKQKIREKGFDVWYATVVVPIGGRLLIFVVR
ncbi:MAG: hypothetical protein ABGY96_13660 [bacterium]|nr:hypothetical protein [Gammaproteobacteria bacterium]HIL94879.1 hypothetical protein [Pseudomonadales bacterium]